MNVNMFAVACRNLGRGKSGLSCFTSGKLRPLKFVYSSSASIVSVINRDPNYKRKPPFPYEEKDLGMIGSWLDRASERFDENTKVIVVDGPIAVGKTKFAQELAKAFDMHFIPEANMDTVYINSYGFDIRTLDDKLPEKCMSTDEKTFCKELRMPAMYQFEMFELRASMYIDALAHVFNTGQGVVMVRSVFSDFVFAEAMTKVNYIRKEVLKSYHEIREDFIPEMLRPHIQIYLDVPVPVVQQRIKERGHEWEVNSKVLTPTYLQHIEDAYKRLYLPQIEKHAELLIYDWTEPGDIELISEDLEKLDFDKYTSYGTKMADWRFGKEQNIADLRRCYTNAAIKHELMGSFSIPSLECPELYLSGDDHIAYLDVVAEAPGNKYTEGYNEDMGDKGIWFKTKLKKEKYPYHNF